jgi:hypothetical protein
MMRNSASRFFDRLCTRKIQQYRDATITANTTTGMDSLNITARVQ